MNLTDTTGFPLWKQHNMAVTRGTDCSCGCTVTTRDVAAKLNAKADALVATFPEKDWAEHVAQLHNAGALDELYSLGANIGMLRADIRTSLILASRP
jgi:hypothetical protein